jgi:hypothetical protein
MIWLQAAARGHIGHRIFRARCDQVKDERLLWLTLLLLNPGQQLMRRLPLTKAALILR